MSFIYINKDTDFIKILKKNLIFANKNNYYHFYTSYSKNIIKIPLTYKNILKYNLNSNFNIIKNIEIELFKDNIILQNFQKTIYEIIVHEIKLKNSILINLYTGFGKTILTIKLIIYLFNNYIVNFSVKKIVIIINIKDLKNQWIKKIKAYNEDLLKYIEIYTIHNVLKYKNKIKCSILIIDEIHKDTNRNLQCLNYLTPYFSIGLTATIKRDDSLHKYFKLFYNSYICFPIDKTCNLNIYQVFLDIENKYKHVKISIQNYAKYESIVQCNFNKIIFLCQLIYYVYVNKIKNTNDKILFLSKRIKVLNKLYEFCQVIDDDDFLNDLYLYYGKKELNTNKKIILSTDKKANTGLDENFTWLFFNCSGKKVLQSIGRIRHKDKNIIDVIDNHYIFINHYKNRLNEYLKYNSNFYTIKI